MKKLSLYILMLWATLGVAKKYSVEVPWTQSQLTAGASFPAVLCQNYAALKQSGGNLATTTSTRGFVIINNYAVLKLSYPQAVGRPSSGTAAVTANVSYEVEQNGQIVTLTDQVTLTIDLSAATLKTTALKKYDNALSATVQLVAPVNVPAAFTGLSLSMAVVTEQYNFLSSNSVVSNVHNNATNITVDGTLFVDWDDLPNAEGYELEWTYVSNLAADGISTLTPNQVTLRDYLFRNNNSRVQTASHGYFIPLVYEKGYIVYRVRALGKTIANGKLIDAKGTWTIQENETSLQNVPAGSLYDYAGLEQSLNWQSSISFAEEGKNKSVVSYHDGSSRNRQAQTKINTDKRAVVGETMYDYNGRPSMQLLPVPVKANNLYYKANFNIPAGQGKTSLSKSDYDVANPGAGCQVNVPVWSTDTGASNYYSQSNHFSKDGGNTGNSVLNRDLIPDAEGYPATQTQYTNDNTGRIAKQSGVGKNYILGSGHETQYLYSVPLQSELSALFGNEVGLNSHYKKNAVMDPNGQLSVSYLDMSGKVVATALAGRKPDAVSDLTEDSSRTISDPYLLTAVSNPLDADGKGKSFIQKIAVMSPTDYTFSYTMSADPYQITCKNVDGSNVVLKMAPVLDANVMLYDKCNVQYLSQSLSLLENFGSGTSGSKSFTATVSKLPVGEYNLVKTVRINQTKLDAYLAQYLGNDGSPGTYTCVLKDDYYVNQALKNIDYSACNLSCSQCKDRVTALISDLTSKQVPITAEEQANLYSNCDVLCQNDITCLSSLNAMVAAMSLDGQYAQLHKRPADIDQTSSSDLNNPPSDNLGDKDITLNNNGTDPLIASDDAIVPEQFPLSIFNSGNQLIPNKVLRTATPAFYGASWKKPIAVVVAGYTLANHKNQVLFSGMSLANATYVETNYQDVDGGVVYADVQYDATTQTYTPAIDGNTPTNQILVVNASIGWYKVPLKYLSDVKEFVKRWQDHFANYLVPYHPEYTYLIECTTRSAINAYESTMVDYNLPEEDVTGQYLTRIIRPRPGSSTLMDTVYVPNVLNNDPLFNGSTALYNKTTFTNTYTNYKVFDYLNASNNPVHTVYNMAQYATVTLGCPDPLATCKNTDCESGEFKKGDSEAWAAFKGFYLNERQHILRGISTQNAVQGQYYNGCIGNEHYLGSAEAQNMRGFYSGMSPFIVVTQSGNFWDHLFRGGSRTVTYINWRAIPINDPLQACSYWDEGLYPSKIRAFYPPLPEIDDRPAVGQSCKEVVQNGTTYQYIDTDCNLQMLDKASLTDKIQQAATYQQCGLCPKAKQLEDLLMDLSSNQSLNQTVNGVNCVTNLKSVTIGQDLKRILTTDVHNAILLNWTGSYNSSTKQLTGKLSIDAVNYLTITLDFSGSTIGNVDFNNLKICCLQTDGVGANQFTVKAYYNVNKLDPVAYASLSSALTSAQLSALANQVLGRVSFDVPGTITYTTTSAGSNIAIDLKNCTFDPVCAPTQEPDKILGLFNTLVQADTRTTEPLNTSNKTNDLITGASPLPLVADSYYEFAARELLGLQAQVSGGGDFVTPFNNYQATWSGAVAGGVLSGHLAYQNAGVNRTYDIRVSPRYPDIVGYTLDFSQVVSFINVSPFDGSGCTTGTCTSNKFYADAVVNASATLKVYYRVVVELSTTTNGAADNAPVATVCNAVK